MSTDSEGTCEVVRITKIEPHPNADKLEIASFETKDGPTAYVCVVGKGQFKPSELAVYCGVDCVVPLAGDQGTRWQFLATRLDGVGKDKYRIRAARLRGVYSEGVLVEAPGNLVALGDEFWERWEITYHQTPVKGASFPPGQNKSKVHKIHFPEYTINSLRKLPNLFEEGEEVIVTEKIHGTNARFGWVKCGLLGSWKFVVGSHRVIKSDLRPWYVKLWHRAAGRERENTGWYGHDTWSEVAKEFDLAKKLWDYRGYIFYGEIYGAGVQDLHYGVLRGVRFFDIYAVRERQFVDFGVMMTILADCGLDEVPVLYRGPFGMDLVQTMSEGKSNLRYADNVIEGTVTRAAKEDRDRLPGQPRKIGKWVGETYRTRKEA